MRKVTVGKLIHELGKFDKDTPMVCCGSDWVYLYTDEKRSYVSIEMQQDLDYGVEITFEKHDEDIFDNLMFRRRKLISALNSHDANFTVEGDEITFPYENGEYVVDCAEDKAQFNGYCTTKESTIKELLEEIGAR